MSNHHRPTNDDVRLLRAVDLACGQFGSTPAALCERTLTRFRLGGLRRTAAVVELREKVVYVVRGVTQASYPRLKWAMGMKSHSTLVEARWRMSRRMACDAGLSEQVIRAVVAVKNALNTAGGGDRRLDDERQGEEDGEEGGRGGGGEAGWRDEHCAAACER